MNYAAGTIIGGLVIGALIGLVLISNNKWSRAIADVYVQLFRRPPLLIQIIWFYSVLPVLLQVGSTTDWIIDAVVATDSSREHIPSGVNF